MPITISTRPDKARRVMSLHADQATQERLRELLTYCPETGVFRWRVSRGGEFAGAIAGSQTGDGRIKIMIDRRLYKAHRLAWLFVHGEWPSGDLDHADRDGSNNRIANLRPAARAENNINSQAVRSKLGLPKGVRRVLKNGKFRAEISVYGVRTHLGTFATPAEAGEAYRRAAARYYGEFAPTN